MFKKILKKEDVTLQKFRTNFTTVDGAQHVGATYNWAIAERPICPVPEYIMISIKEDGYLMDVDRLMYPLYNIISIEWELVEEKRVEDQFGDFDVFVKEK